MAAEMDATTALAVGYLALAQGLYPLVLGSLVHHQHIVLYPLAEVCAIVGAVYLGSFEADIDSGDGWQPVTLVQALGVILVGAGYACVVNASVSYEEASYARLAVDRLRTELPPLADMSVAELCHLHPRDGLRAYTAADVELSYCSWKASQDLLVLGEAGGPPSLGRILEALGLHDRMAALAREGVTTVGALEALDGPALLRVGLTAGDRTNIRKQVYEASPAAWMMAQLAQASQADLAQLAFPPWVAQGWQRRAGLSEPLRAVLEATELSSLEEVLCSNDLLTVKELALQCDEELEDEVGLEPSHAGALLDHIEVVMGCVGLGPAIAQLAGTRGLDTLEEKGVRTLRQLQRVESGALVGLGMSDATRCILLEKAVELHVASTAVLQPPASEPAAAQEPQPRRRIPTPPREDPLSAAFWQDSEKASVLSLQESFMGLEGSEVDPLAPGSTQSDPLPQPRPLHRGGRTGLEGTPSRLEEADDSPEGTPGAEIDAPGDSAIWDMAHEELAVRQDMRDATNAAEEALSPDQPKDFLAD